MPTYVPATFAVYPERNWYIACYLVSSDTGGNTPKASQVSKIIFFGWPPIAGILAEDIKSNG